MAMPLTLECDAHYAGTLEKIRTAIKNSGRNVDTFEIIRVTAAQKFPPMNVAVNHKTVYIRALQPAPDDEKGATRNLWYYFKRTEDQLQMGEPEVPNLGEKAVMKLIKGGDDYISLGLNLQEAYSNPPGNILCQLREIFPPDGSDGRIGEDSRKRAVLALCFLVAEGARFGDIGEDMAKYCANPSSINFGRSYGSTVHDWAGAGSNAAIPKVG